MDPWRINTLLSTKQRQTTHSVESGCYTGRCNSADFDTTKKTKRMGPMRPWRPEAMGQFNTATSKMWNGNCYNCSRWSPAVVHRGRCSDTHTHTHPIPHRHAQARNRERNIECKWSDESHKSRSGRWATGVVQPAVPS